MICWHRWEDIGDKDRLKPISMWSCMKCGEITSLKPGGWVPIVIYFGATLAAVILALVSQ